MPRVLVVEDDPAHRALLGETLNSIGVEVDHVGTGSTACKKLLTDAYSAVILDVTLPDMSGFEVQRWAADRTSVPPIVFVTADDDLDHAVSAMRSGANHYIVKKRNYLRQVDAAVRELLAVKQAAKADPFSALVGASTPMVQLRARLAEIASSSVAVLVSGETGTGKELVAKCLHRASHVSAGPFVAISCPALSQRSVDRWGTATSQESALARGDLVTLAENGTLLLDEVGELPLTLQGALLRLTDGIGALASEAGATHRPPRIVASTKDDLERKVATGQFRADLFHRLNGVRIEIPPLRERKSDIPTLAKHFATQFLPSGVDISFEKSALNQLIAANWFGNVRELENTIHRTVAGWSGGPLFHCDFGPRSLPDLAPGQASSREDLVALLRQYRGRLEPVATIFGVSKRTLLRRMAALGLRGRDFTSR